MQSALKRQAETYFQTVSDFEKAHNQSTAANKVGKFYSLLLSKYLGTDQLSSKVVAIHTKKLIQWRPFLDAIWGFSMLLPQDSPAFKSLSEFIGQIDRKNIVERSLLMKVLPEALIDAAGLQKKQTLQKKARVAYTKYYYDQRKHNLMIENNQGFARLCLLMASMNKSQDYEGVWNKILSLIGNFDLDPDRVMDLLIESYVQSANTQICLKLIKNFNPQSIVALIGNKILRDCPAQFSQKLTYAGKVEIFLLGTEVQIYKDLNNIINPKLITLICQLIKCKFISLESMIPYLNPSNSVFERQQVKRLLNGKDKINKSFRLLMEQPTQAQIISQKQQENLQFYGQMLHSSKLAIINGFVNLNDWYHFTKMWSNYQQKIDLIIYQPLLRSLMQLLEWVIDPFYSKISLSKYFKSSRSSVKQFPVSPNYQEQEQIRKEMTQCKDLSVQQFKKISEIMDIIKIYIGFSSRTFIKVCRLFARIIKEPSLFISQTEKSEMVAENQACISPAIKQSIESIIKNYLLPGMSLQKANPSLTKQLYKLMELFDYRFRYKCYLNQYYHGMTSNPCLANIFFKARNSQIVIVNNLSDKNKKVFMKKMAKLTHNQAMQAFYWIFRRIMMEDYEKVVPEVVGVLANCCPLTHEMSIFIALYILSQQKEPAMNFKNGEQSAWFKNLINFISLFYRKYLDVDIQPVFDYIIMKIGQDVSELQNNQQVPGALLGLLHEILSKMFCNFVLKQVNTNKLEMLCAGPYLQLETMDISSEIKASKKSKFILQKFFWGKSVDQYDGQSLAISLLVLLTQKRAELIHKSSLLSLKIIGDTYDDYTTLIIQLIRVLNQLSVDYVQYAKLLPENSLNLLINEYKLPIQIAFEIYRPSIKHISTMSPSEWTEFSANVGAAIDKYVACEEKYINGYSQNQRVKSYLNENYSKVKNFMSNQFFTAFWMLTLDSIYFPAKLYSQKIEQVKQKKAQTKPGRAKSDRNQKDIDKAKTLYTNLKNEEIKQSQKVQNTTNETNILRLRLDYFKNLLEKDPKQSKDDKSVSIAIQQFAQIFTQICLLPRMMLDPEEALYCMKITLEVIKANRLSSGKSIKLLIFVIEHVMNSLPYATERQASYCLAIFLSEILSIIANWNDQPKLKQDLKKWLGIQENFVDENYTRLKKQFIRLYVRFGNIVKSIKDEPYNIKNALYLLEKVDIIPAYKKQAEDLQNYLRLLKQKYSQTLHTIIEMQLSIIERKKKTLPIVEQDGQSSTSRTELPTFSNLSNPDPPVKNKALSPYRSPISNKNQFIEKVAANIQSKSPIYYKNEGRRDRFENQRDRDQERNKNKFKDDDKYKVGQTKQQSERQIQAEKSKIESTSKMQYQSAPEENKQKMQSFQDRKRKQEKRSVSPSQAVSQKPNSSQIKTVAERKAEQQKERQKQKQKQRQRQKQRQKQRQRQRQKQKQKQRQRQRQRQRQKQKLMQLQRQRQKQKQKQNQKQRLVQIERQKQAEKQRQAQRQKQKQKEMEKQRQNDKIGLQIKPEPSTVSDRPKTVKELKDENARKAAIYNPLSTIPPSIPPSSTLSTLPAPTIIPSEGQQKIASESEQNEKLKRQNQKDPVQHRSQKPQWPKQTQRNEKPRQFQPTLQFTRKNNYTEKKSLSGFESNKINIEDPDKRQIRQSEDMIGPILDNSVVIIKEQKMKSSISPYRTPRSNKDQVQGRMKEPQAWEKDKSQDRQRFQRQNKNQWKVGEKQDRYSQDNNQDRQRQHRRQNRAYDKRDKNPRVQSRWKEREDYRDKHNEDRRKESRDRSRSRRKQDKYQKQKERDRGRKNDHKGKERSRQHNYRK